MYFMPHGRTAEPRPAVPSGHGWYPDSLNNPTQLPMHAPSSEAVLPAQLHDGEQFDKLTHDLFNLAGQLFRLDGTTSLTCNLCRAGLSTLQAMAHMKPELVPDVLTAACKAFDLLGKFHLAQQCSLTFAAGMYGGPITQVMSYGNFSGSAPDATLVCAQIPMHFCPWPSEDLTEEFLDNWFYHARQKPQHVVERWAEKKKKGCTRQPLRVPHFSDIHVDGRYMVGAESNCTSAETKYCCHSVSFNENYWNKDRVEQGKLPRANISVPAGYWGELTCDAPWSLAADAIETIGSMGPYDLALFTGDLVVHDDLFRYSHDLIKYSAQALFDALKRALPHTPVFATMGNHESSPENFWSPHAMPDGRGHQLDWDSDFMASVWQAEGWIDAEHADQARKHYTGFSVSPRPGLRIISMNSDVRAASTH